jgi:hypothetical protein
MGIVPRQRPVATAWTALLVVGAVLVLFDLARVVFFDLARSDRPSDRRCAELWNGPANQTNRSLVRGRSFPLATVWGIEPNKAGQPEPPRVHRRLGSLSPAVRLGSSLR